MKCKAKLEARKSLLGGSTPLRSLYGKEALRRADFRDFEMCELISDVDGLAYVRFQRGISSLRAIHRLASSPSVLKRRARGEGNTTFLDNRIISSLYRVCFEFRLTTSGFVRI